MALLRTASLSLAVTGAVALGVWQWGPAGWTTTSQSQTAPGMVPLSGTQSLQSDVAAVDKEITSHPDNARAWAQKGGLLFEARDFGNAIAPLEKAVAMNPKDAESWSLLGEAYFQRDGKDVAVPAPAQQAFAKALALNPKDYRARYFKALDRYFAGDKSGATMDWMAMLSEVPAGSEADHALRAALTKSSHEAGLDITQKLAEAAAKQPQP